MAKMVIEIEDCIRCPYFGVSEDENNCICSLNALKLEEVPTGEKSDFGEIINIPIPDWCPQRIDEATIKTNDDAISLYNESRFNTNKDEQI